MAMKIGYEIERLQELISAFQKSPQTTTRNMMLAMQVVLRNITELAKARHKFISRSGNLEHSIKYRVIPGTLSGEAYLDEGIAKYGPFQHEGTGLHGPNQRYIEIFPKAGKALRWPAPGGGGFIFAKKVLKNPGVEGDQFLYKAGEAVRPTINAVFNRYANRAIKEAGLE